MSCFQFRCTRTTTVDAGSSAWNSLTTVPSTGLSGVPSQPEEPRQPVTGGHAFQSSPAECRSDFHRACQHALSLARPVTLRHVRAQHDGGRNRQGDRRRRQELTTVNRGSACGKADRAVSCGRAQHVLRRRGLSDHAVFTWSRDVAAMMARNSERISGWCCPR